MDRVEDWFFGWLEYHQMLHPHRSWMRAECDNALDFYEGWIRAFERLGVMEDLARRASRDLQECPPKFLNDQLPAIRAKLVELMAEQAPATSTMVAAPDPGLVRACVQSHGCPECGGTGWAQRRAHWLATGWHPVVDLFCRCPAGRYRRANDPDLAAGKSRNYDDLQAHPEIWNPELDSHLWSNRPTTIDVETEGTEGQWRYLAPGEVAPEASEELPLAGVVGAIPSGR